MPRPTAQFSVVQFFEQAALMDDADAVGQLGDPGQDLDIVAVPEADGHHARLELSAASRQEHVVVRAGGDHGLRWHDEGGAAGAGASAGLSTAYLAGAGAAAASIAVIALAAGDENEATTAHH